MGLHRLRCPRQLKKVIQKHYVKLKINMKDIYTKKIFLLCLALMFLALVANAQTLEVSGKVTSMEDGESLPGVSITVSGTSMGVVSDADGMYKISIPDGANSTLVFSFIGFRTEKVSVGGRSVIDVQLVSDVQFLSEVVVVGYGTQKKRDLTGSVASVSSKDFEGMPVRSIDQALQGRSAGVQVTSNSGAPGGGVSVRIRGATSPNNNEPLYVVDGFPVTGGLNYINPNDVESVEILKDASSAAIYGARAANGVVLITTKKGKEGTTSAALDVFYGFQEVAKRMDLLNASEFATLANEAYTNSNQIPNPDWANPSGLGEGTDWQEAIFRTAPIQSYNLSVSGGNEKTKAFLSGNFFRQDGTIIGSHFKRFTVRMNLSHDVSKWLRFGANTTLSNESGRSVFTGDAFGSVVSRALMSIPTIPVYNTDGSYGVAPVGQPLYYPASLDNPVALIEVPETGDKTRRVLGNAFMEIEPIKGLVYRMNAGADVSYYTSQSFNPTFQRGPFNNPVANAGYSTNQNAGWLFENTLSYSRTVGKHFVSAVTGVTAQKSRFEYINGSARNFPNESIQVLDGGAPNDALNPNNRSVGGSFSEYAIASYLGRLNYTFNDRYLVSATFRRDGSVRFGPNNRFAFFPAYSVGWRISEESFMSGVPIVSNLMLKGSWGKLGNDNIGNFGYLATLIPGNRQYTLNQAVAPGIIFSRIPNPQLKWESTTVTNVGFDLGLRSDQITFSAAYFIKRTDDLLINQPLPLSAGVRGNSQVLNAGSVENRGFEFDLGYRKSNGPFTWSINANLTTLKNEVISLGDAKEIFGISPTGNFNNITRSVVGQPLGSFYGFVTDGIFQTQEEIDESAQSDQNNLAPGDRRYKDIAGPPDENGNPTGPDGFITDHDRTNIGNPFPDFFYGLSFNAAYKGFDLVLFLQGVQGNEIFSVNKRQLSEIKFYNGAGVSNVSREALSRWTGPGTSNEYPRAVYNNDANNGRASDFYVEDGSFLRFKNVQLGYTFPAELMKRVSITKLRMYVSAQNLFTITKYSGFDPELGATPNGDNRQISTGIDIGTYPVSRTITFGVNLGL